MLVDLRALCEKKIWHDLEQNQAEGLGLKDTQGSFQPKPREGQRQTAQSS